MWATHKSNTPVATYCFYKFYKPTFLYGNHESSM